MSSKIKFDYTSMDEADYIVRIREITTATPLVPAFAPLAAKVTATETAVDDLETKSNAYNVALQTCTTLMTERDDARVAAEDAVRSLANAAEGETQDSATLLGGGWHLRDAPTPIGPMPAPQNLTATGGDMEGEVDLACDPVYGRDSYIAEYAINALGPWEQFYVGKKSSCTAVGLAPGQLCYFRMLAVGPLGPGPWSDIAQKRAT
jgi:hypothetical protein